MSSVCDDHIASKPWSGKVVISVIEPITFGFEDGSMSRRTSSQSPARNIGAMPRAETGPAPAFRIRFLATIVCSSAKPALHLQTINGSNASVQSQDRSTRSIVLPAAAARHEHFVRTTRA